MVCLVDPLEQMLRSLTDFDYIKLGEYRFAMKLRFVQTKTKCKCINITKTGQSIYTSLYVRHLKIFSHSTIKYGNYVSLKLLQ